jgi:hypothetical protein
VRLNLLLAGRGLEVDDLLDAADGVCPCREHQIVGDWNVPAKCHVMASYLISNSQNQPSLCSQLSR